MSEAVHDEQLAGGKRGKGVEIDLMDAAVDDEVARHAQENQQVDAHVKPRSRQDGRREAAERGGRDAAGSDQDEASMKFGLLAPKDGEREEGGKANHVEKRDDQKRLDGRSARLRVNQMEPPHDDGGGDADKDHRGGKSGSDPSGGAMELHVVGLYEHRLEEEEAEPSDEERAVNPEKRGPGRSGIQQIFAHCVAESVEDDGGNQQRHQEIEVLVEERRALRRRFGAADCAVSDFSLSNGCGRHWRGMVLRNRNLATETLWGGRRRGQNLRSGIQLRVGPVHASFGGSGSA